MLTSSDIPPFLTKWNEAKDLAVQGASTLLHAPRYYGKKYFLHALRQRLAKYGDAAMVNLSSNVLTPSRQVDFNALWAKTVAQLRVKSRVLVHDGSSFESAFRSLCERSEQRIYVTLGGGGRGHESQHHELIGLFNHLLLEAAVRQEGSFCVIAMDDYSLFHYVTGKGLESDIAYFEKLHVPPMTSWEIEECIQQLTTEFGRQSNMIEQIVNGVLAITGGHIGLASDLLTFAIPRLDSRDSYEEIEAEMRERVWSSNVLEGLALALSEDPDGLSRTALDYEEPSSPEPFSQRIHTLRELGILIRDGSSSRLALCPGVIADLVKEVAQGRFKRLRRAGTFVSELGPRVFEAGNVPINNDDFIVVLLSDFHCSEDQYRFLLEYPGGSVNRGKTSLVDLVIEDLEKLGLVGQIDALVLAGDIAGNGKPEEYDRAEVVITTLLSRMKVPAERTVIVPGNHDLDWTPGKLAVMEANRPVSKGNYGRFLRLIGKSVSGGVDMVSVKSKSGRRMLRILGFDSNEVEGPQASGIGYISQAAFHSAEARMSKGDATAPGGTFTWLVVHHHVFPATSAAIYEAERRNVSVLANSSEFRAKALSWSAELIMHGHEHQPCVTVARTWPAGAGLDFAPLVVVGAGSISAHRDLLGEFSRNHYFVIHRREHDVLIRSRCMGDFGTSFVGHNDMTIPLSIDNDQESRKPIE
jgi:hypothetical protein